MSKLSRDEEHVLELWTRQGTCQIELMSGDITTLPLEDAVDIIMVSAFPGDYAPMSGTVIGSLKNKLGISVLELSDDKELDLRALFSCWLSKPITTQDSPFKRLLCFERRRGVDMTVASQISQMFRVFVPVFNNQDHSVITPLLATGHQGYNKTVVCEAMVKAAIQWIYAGLPLRKFQIVIYEGVDSAVETMFSELKKKHARKNDIMKRRILKKLFDVYITFNIKDEGYMQKIKMNLEKDQSDMKIYIGTKQFDENKVWQDEIFKIMVSCKRIIVILSPAFLENSECLDQYNMAMCCNRLLGANVLIPFYVDTVSNLPTYMGLVQWIDCRVRKDGDTVDAKLKTACSQVVLSLKDNETAMLDQDAGQANETVSQKDKFQFDVFISYSHKNPQKAEKLLETFKKVDPNIKVFFDRSALTTGSNWQKMLYESVGECRCFVALISASYIASTVCQEEYSLALARYLTKDKDMMMVPLKIEPMSDVPSSISAITLTDTTEDFDQSAMDLAISITHWLNLTVEKRPPQLSVQEPADIEAILATCRCNNIRKQYRVQKTKNRSELKRLVPVAIPKEKMESVDMSSVDIAISYASDSTHLAGSFCALVDMIYQNLNISVHSNITQKRFSDLDTAKKIVMFISNKFLHNEHQMQELHLALCRQRSQKSKVLYLMKATNLWDRPFFPRILTYDVASTDEVWTAFAEQCLGNKNNDKKTVFGKVRRLEHASSFFCNQSEYLAVTKAVDDVLESLLNEREETFQQTPLLLNVHELKLRLDDIKTEEALTKQMQRQGTDTESNLKITTSTATAMNADKEITDTVPAEEEPTDAVQAVEDSTGEECADVQQAKSHKAGEDDTTDIVKKVDSYQRQNETSNHVHKHSASSRSCTLI